MSQPLIPIVFGASVTHTEANLPSYGPIFYALETSQLDPYYVHWDGISRAEEARDRIIAKYLELSKSHDRVALGGHSGGAYAAVEAAAWLEQNGHRPHALILYSLSPWYAPVFSAFMRYRHRDADLSDGYYSLEQLGITGTPLPAISTPVIMVYGADEDFYLHLQAGAALQAWPGTEFVAVEKASHAIISLAAHF